MLTGVRAQRSRSPQFPQHSRLPSSRPSPTSRVKTRSLPSRPRKPGLGSVCPGKPLTARGRGSGERVQSKLCQRRPERSSQGPSGRAAARCVQKAACSPPSRDTRRSPGRPQPHLAPAARHLEQTRSRRARGSPTARTHAHARHRARRLHSRARPSRAHSHPRPRTALRTLLGSARERDAGALFPSCFISRRAPCALGPGAGPTGQTPPQTRPLSAVDRWGRWSLRPTPSGCFLLLSSSPYTPKMNCTLGSAGHAAS